jgi:hypothetical protein
MGWLHRLRHGDALRIAAELGFAALAFASILPLWQVEVPPIQDLPQHLAAVRVIHDYDQPALAFQRYFEVALGRTQYLTVYLAAHLLAYAAGVVVATKLVLSAGVAAAPYAMRLLLRSLGKDEAASVFVFALTYNAHLILGFLNFTVAIPLMLVGLALAIRQRAESSDRRAIALGAVLLVTFYTHVVPFAVLAGGAALAAIGASKRQTLRRLLPLVPASAAAAVWTQFSPAGRAVVAATGSADHGAIRADYQPWGQALRALPDWLTDVLQSETDDRLLVAWLIVVLAGFLLAQPVRTDDVRGEHGRAGERVVAALCVISATAYFLAPAAYDWIWPINARFPLLALLLLIACFPRWSVPTRFGAIGASAAIALWSFHEVSAAFRQHDVRTTAALQRVIEVIPPGQRVAGLIWESGSDTVKFHPLLHAVALYQALRGGAVMFSFADFPQSPIRFRAATRPPGVAPRWEWLPQNVDPERELDWYDYVLTRGGPGTIARSESWLLVQQDAGFRVWKRRAAAQPPM